MCLGWVPCASGTVARQDDGTSRPLDAQNLAVRTRRGQGDGSGDDAGSLLDSNMATKTLQPVARHSLCLAPPRNVLRICGGTTSADPFAFFCPWSTSNQGFAQWAELRRSGRVQRGRRPPQQPHRLQLPLAWLMPHDGMRKGSSPEANYRLHGIEPWCQIAVEASDFKHGAGQERLPNNHISPLKESPSRAPCLQGHNV